MTPFLKSTTARLFAVAVIAVASASQASAQRQAAKPCSAPATILVAWPHSADKKVALEFRDKVASAIKDALEKELCVVDTDRMTAWLSQSKFPTDTALPTRDWMQLATIMRGDEVLELGIKQNGKSFDVSGRITLVRDESLRDSLPKIATADNIGQAAKLLVAELKKVNAMLTQEVACYRGGRAGNFAAAETAGRAALAAYPGNIARLCIATALRGAKTKPEEVTSLSEEVRKSDPTNMLALLNLLNTAYERNDQQKYAEIGTSMLSLEPTSQYAETIISNLASYKMTDVALKLVQKSLEDDPESVSLKQIEFRLIYSSDRLKDAIKSGEALAKLDTASVDSAFVIKMAGAYVRDSQPAKSLEWLTRGTKKWPDNILISRTLAQQLRQSGKPQMAIDEYKRIMKFNPDAEKGTRLYIATVYNEMKQVDSAAAWARRAADAGDDKAQASGVVLQIGNSLLQSAQTTHAPDDFKKVIPYVAYADSVAGNDLAKFVWGYSALQIATAGLMQMQSPAGQTCPIAKETRAWLAIAAEKVLAGARANPQNAPTLLQTIPSYIDGVDRVLTQLRCQ